MPLVKPQLSAGASVVWDRIAPALEADGRVLAGEEDLLADYCEFTAIIEKAREQLAGTDGTRIGEGGKPAKHPAMNAYREAVNVRDKLARQLGIGAASRKQLGHRPNLAGGLDALRASITPAAAPQKIAGPRNAGKSKALASTKTPPTKRSARVAKKPAARKKKSG